MNDVAVIDPVPIFRYGLAACLTAAGYRVETPDDPPDWAARGGSSLVLLTLADADSWLLLADLAVARPVVALLAVGSAEEGVRAVRDGARSVVTRAVTPETLRRTVAATVDGQSVLPAAVSRALADSALVSTRSTLLSADQLSWLRELAAGRTVAGLADLAGYSERAMFRLLRATYRRMGVQTRTEAIARAGEWGWLRSVQDPV
jgi:DNA-binding NarL/FixJ family response regulator